MPRYALSIPYKWLEDPLFRENALKTGVTAFEVVAGNETKPGGYAKAIGGALSSGLEILSVHCPFGLTPWIPSRPPERKISLEAFSSLVEEWSAANVKNYTMHGGSELDADEPRDAQIEGVRGFLSSAAVILSKAGASVNIEYLPRKCIGNTPGEIERIVEGFDENLVGICLDVNHGAHRTLEMPYVIESLGERIKSLHLSDTDGIDECHWFPGYGIVPWAKVVSAAKRLKSNPVMILEVFEVPFPDWQSSWHHNGHMGDLAAMKRNVFFLENAEEMERRLSAFSLP